jgi:hypothetical protein
MTALYQRSAWVTRRAPAVTHRSCLELAIAPAAVRGARHWAANMLAKAEIEQDLADTVVLLVSELATNAIHAVSELMSPPACPAAPASARATGKHRVWLAIELSQELLRVEVHDTACVPVPRQAVQQATWEESGRGLAVMAALASYWGWSPDPFGKVVWCELVR